MSDQINAAHLGHLQVRNDKINSVRFEKMNRFGHPRRGERRGRVPELAEVRDEAERDYLVERREAANDALYKSLRDRYTVRYDGGPAPAPASEPTPDPSRSP